jgi:hypothetical protein
VLIATGKNPDAATMAIFAVSPIPSPTMTSGATAITGMV